MLPSLRSDAAEVNLEWDANTEHDLAGYRIYYGTSSGVYSHSVDVGNVVQTTVSGLFEDVTYYFVATAYNDGEDESGYSNEISWAYDAGTGEITPIILSAIKVQEDVGVLASYQIDLLQVNGPRDYVLLPAVDQAELDYNTGRIVFEITPNSNDYNPSNKRYWVHGFDSINGNTFSIIWYRGKPRLSISSNWTTYLESKFGDSVFSLNQNQKYSFEFVWDKEVGIVTCTIAGIVLANSDLISIPNTDPVSKIPLYIGSESDSSSRHANGLIENLKWFDN